MMHEVHDYCVADRILKEVARAPGCLLDELRRTCSDVSWNQVFNEIDLLSRSGHVILTIEGPGRYAVRLPH